MKNKYLLFILILSAAMCFSASCKKHGVDPDPLSQLPPATQTGANTFGCLINGQAFLPYEDAFSGRAETQCTYIYLNNTYNFSVSGTYDKISNNFSSIVGLGITPAAITEGQTYKLQALQANTGIGAYTIITQNGLQTNEYQTSSIYNGQVHITKFDQVNQIASGTFFFNAVNPNGDTVHITDGRFDMKYTR